MAGQVSDTAEPTCPPGAPVTDPITARDTDLAAVLAALEQADEQYHAWRDERESLIRQAKALGASHRRIAEHTSLSHTGIGRLIHRTTPDRTPDLAR